MTTIQNIDDFLKADNLKIDSDIKIETFDSKTLEDFNDVNINSIKFVESEALDALLEASKISDKTDVPSTPSFQPLNEAGILTSGEALNKSEIGALTNNSMSIQEDAASSLEATAKLSPDTNLNLTTESLNKIKESQEILANGVKSLANRAELANSGIKFAGGKLEFAGNNISLGTDTSFHIASPIVSTVADVDNRQSKSIQETTNHKTSVAKSTFTQIEGLQSTVAGNSMKTVTENNITVSNISTTTAIEKMVSSSNSIENSANELIKNRSKNGITNEADGTIYNQSPNINLVAAQSAKSSLVNKLPKASNALSNFTDNKNGSFNINTLDSNGNTVEFQNIKTDESNLEKWKSIGGLEGQSKDNIKPTEVRKGGGNLNILADGDGGTVSIINKNMIMSSTSNMNTSIGGNLNQVAQGSITNSAAFVNNEADAGLTLSGSAYIRQQSGTTGTMISNGFTFAGFRFPKLKKFIDKISNIPLQIREIPSLSSIPLVIGIQDLQDCLPKKYTDPNTPENVLKESQDELNIPDEIAAPTAKDAAQREKASALPIGKEVGDASGGILDKVQGIGGKKIDGNTLLASDNSPTNSGSVPKNKLTSAAAVFKGGSDIYPLDNEEAFDLFERQGKEILDPDASEETGGPKLTIDLIKSISELSITNLTIKLNQKIEIANLLKTDIKALKHYLLNKLITDKSLLKEEDKYTKEQQELISKLLKNTEVKKSLELLEKEIVSKSAVGGAMSFVTNAYNNVSSSISIASNIIEDSKNSDIFGKIKGASDLAGSLTGKDVFTDLGQIVNSSKSLSNLYGQVNSIIQDKNLNTSEIIEKLNFQDIQTVISQGLNTIGIDNLEKASSIAQILSSIKNSEEYKQNGLTSELETKLIIDIVNETGLTNGEAQSLYNQSKDLISNILSGDVESIVEGSELQNILGFFIGQSNAAILTNVKDIYTKGKNILGQTQSLYSQGESLYQDGRDLYSTLQSVPALVGMMNEYKIPLLNQVKTVFQCLDLINRIKNIINNVKDAASNFNKFENDIGNTLDLFSDLLTSSNTKTPSILEQATEGLIKGDIITTNTNTNTNINNDSSIIVNNEEEIVIQNQNTITDTNTLINNTPINKDSCSTVIFSYAVDTKDSANPNEWTEPISDNDVIDLIEKLPRLTQIYNSIKELPTNIPVELFNELTPEQITTIQNTTINVPINACYIAPKLNLVEATVKVLQIKEGVILYKLEYIKALGFNNKNIFPSNNTIIQIYVDNFYNTKLEFSMDIIKTKEFFTPNIYSFKTTIFDREKNLGVAYLMNSQNRIHLMGINNTVYNYSITDIGNKLMPNILDAYIVA